MPIGVSPTLGHAQVDADVARAFDRALPAFEDTGAHVELADPPIAPSLDTLRTLFAARAAFTVRHLDAQSREQLDPAVREAAVRRVASEDADPCTRWRLGG